MSGDPRVRALVEVTRERMARERTLSGPARSCCPRSFDRLSALCKLRAQVDLWVPTTALQPGPSCRFKRKK